MSPKKVLVVEDEPDVAKAIRMELEAGGLQVINAFDGLQGVTFAHSQKPDLIILDISMPAGNGFTVLSRLKSSAGTWGIPVMILTASTSKDVEEKTKEAGARYFFKKPYDPVELINCVNQILNVG